MAEDSAKMGHDLRIHSGETRLIDEVCSMRNCRKSVYLSVFLITIACCLLSIPLSEACTRVVYLGPVAPHWEVESEFGDRLTIEAFRERALARLMLLPPHDPQFRRNRERVVRDAERENLLLEWDLGLPDEGAPA